MHLQSVQFFSIGRNQNRTVYSQIHTSNTLPTELPNTLQEMEKVLETFWY